MFVSMLRTIPRYLLSLVFRAVLMSANSGRASAAASVASSSSLAISGPCGVFGAM